MNSDEKTWIKVSRSDLPTNFSLFVVRENETEESPFQVILVNDMTNATISLAAYKNGNLSKVLSDADNLCIPDFAFEQLGLVIKSPSVEENVVIPLSTQELLVAKYGSQAQIDISCSGWANYRYDENNGEPWKYDFSFQVENWEEESCELSELVDYEIERVWGLLNMEEAWIQNISISVDGKQIIDKHYSGDDEPLVSDLEETVDNLLHQ